jgi:hypothetical protein
MGISITKDSSCRYGSLYMKDAYLELKYQQYAMIIYLIRTLWGLKVIKLGPSRFDHLDLRIGPRQK